MEKIDLIVQKLYPRTPPPPHHQQCHQYLLDSSGLWSSQIASQFNWNLKKKIHATCLDSVSVWSSSYRSKSSLKLTSSSTDHIKNLPGLFLRASFPFFTSHPDGKASRSQPGRPNKLNVETTVSNNWFFRNNRLYLFQGKLDLNIFFDSGVGRLGTLHLIQMTHVFKIHPDLLRKILWNQLFAPQSGPLQRVNDVFASPLTPHKQTSHPHSPATHSPFPYHRSTPHCMMSLEDANTLKDNDNKTNTTTTTVSITMVMTQTRTYLRVQMCDFRVVLNSCCDCPLGLVKMPQNLKIYISTRLYCI